MNGTALTRITGIVLTLIGLTAMIGWFIQIPIFISVNLSQINIVFNSALSFFLLGIVFLISDLRLTWHANISALIGCFVALMAILALSQNIFDYSLGIDYLFTNSGLDQQNDQSSYLGRMSDNSALIFLFSGLALVLLSYSAKRYVARFVQICIFSTLILGISALIGYVFEIKVLYSWNLANQMSLLSAIGNTFLGIGLWALWQHKEYDISRQILPGKEKKEFIVLGFIILLSTVLLSSFALIKWILHSNNYPVSEVKASIMVAVVIGMSLLLWQIIPLVQKIIKSEKNLLDTNTLLKESENKFRSAFDNMAIGMALISTQGVFFKVNKALCVILGYKESELLDIDIYKIIHPDDFIEIKSCMNEMIWGRNTIYKKVQRYLHKNGDIVWVSSSMSLICDVNKAPLYFITQLQNITTEKRAEEQLRHLAYHDALTGLYNRNCLEEKMEEILLNAQSHNRGFAVIFLDLDRFKNINDTIGHDAGDMLLKVVAQRLKNNVRSTDIIARIGGDEFVLVLNELNKVDKISKILQNILTHLLQPIAIKGHEIYVTTSIGVSIYPYDGNDIQTLMKNADLALYRAKDIGRNNFQFCTLEMTVKAQQKMTRQNAIVQAMAKNEFTLYYQPKLNVINKTISGVEALLRWHNPEYSNVNAAEIIQLAEETGLIIGLNEWVFQTACLQVNEWHKNGYLGLNLSVNLSGKQFKQVNFVGHLLGMLERTGFPPDRLELEITEGLIMQDPEYILHILHSLKDKKISIAIDDFGTGYSSLDYLRRFSIDKIKIDRKFIQTLTLDVASTSVVSAIIAMSNKLGIKTVAEGVETKEQYEFLVKEKCTEIQGYYVCPPSDVGIISEYLKNPVIQS